MADLFTDNTKMPKNWLPAQPLWQTITVNPKYQKKLMSQFGEKSLNGWMDRQTELNLLEDSPAFCRGSKKHKHLHPGLTFINIHGRLCLRELKLLAIDSKTPWRKLLVI